MIHNVKHIEHRLISLIQYHQQAKKNFAIEDAYKLIYQSVFGGGHILANPYKAWKELKNEFAVAELLNDEPLFEDISIIQELIRINLRPYKKSGGSPEALFELILVSAREHQGSKTNFCKLWYLFIRLVEKEVLSFDKQKLIIFDKKLNTINYPPVHHSTAYREANMPSYRIIKKAFLNKVWDLND